jgi:hypothetical protein
MKRVEVEPRTPDWFAIRSETWTASTAAVLAVRENAELLRDCAAARGLTLDIAPLLAVGLESFYGHTLWTEWALKTGRIGREKDNPHMARGKENEERVLREFEEKKMLIVERDITARSSVDEWLLASFDAVAPPSSDTTVTAKYGFPVEAKCPAFRSRKKLWDSKKAGQLAIMGLPYYWCQVQHQILVAESPYGWFVAAGVEPDPKTKEPTVVFPIIEQVPRDEDFLRAYQAAAKFYYETFIYNFEEPPKVASDHELLDKLAVEASFDRAVSEADHDTAVDIYLEAVEAEAAAAKRRKELEEKVLEAAAKVREEGKNVVLLANRLEVSYSAPTSTSWQKVAKELTKKLGLPEVPKEVLDACESKGSERAKLKEVV